MDKFQHKYRIPSARLRNWDYGWNASYFVTICTANHECVFGEVANDKMTFSEIGKIAEQCWLEIPEHFPFVKLDVHVVMPNHVHGIVIIDKPDDGRNVADSVDGTVGDNMSVDVWGTVETQNFASLPSTSPKPPTSQPSTPQNPLTSTQPAKNQFGPQSQNLASVIRGYKTGVTKYARNNNIEFEWQSRFHDHIIRNDRSYRLIRNYIINNLKKWNNDEFNNDTIYKNR